MLTPAQAQEQIARHLSCLPAGPLPLGQCAGAVLREQVVAERDQPPFARVTMDGVAVASHAAHPGQSLRIQAQQAAGDPPLTLENPGCCIEIMTGAVLPAGCDAVVPVEQLRKENGTATITDGAPPQPGQFVHPRGSDRHQGATLLTSGTRLGAPEIAAAASAGRATLRVTQQPAITVISTGNELVEPGQPVQPWQLRRSNAPAIVAALHRHGFTRVADDHLPDDAATLAAHIDLHLARSDVLVLSGGVSMGKLDLVPAALAACGVQPVFHKVAQRPGKPLWFGLGPGGTPVFALPGNPVSTLVCLVRYVLPALRQCMMERDAGWGGEAIVLDAPVAAHPSLCQFLPATVAVDAAARHWATVLPCNGSGDYAALVGTAGFIELVPGSGDFPRGSPTRLHRW